MPVTRPRTQSPVSVRLCELLIVLAALVLPAAQAAAPASAPVVTDSGAAAPEAFSLNAAPEAVPILAYYYIWFDPSSWGRAKTDYPRLGRYSSDDAAVMEQHIAWAQEAGIQGFIVSWKWTDQLDRRLEQLATIADRRGFKLWVIYQGLDFQRDPLPVDQVDMDLQHFLETFAHHPSLNPVDGEPVVIWSGTWKVATGDVRSVAATFRPHMLILASERNVEGYRRLSGGVDGNAYYWASADPASAPAHYLGKLRSMGDAVHADGGLWIAPAAPGFDARLVGGSMVIPRDGTATLQHELGVALQSSPDAVGLISWNEFSENTQIEPSERFGDTALRALGTRHTVAVATTMDFDSSAPGATDRHDRARLALVATTGLTLIAVFALSLVRAGRSERRSAVPAPAARKGGPI